MFNLRPSSRFQNLLARIAGNENAYQMNPMNQDEKFMSDIAEHIADIAGSGGGGGGTLVVTVAPAENGAKNGNTKDSGTVCSANKTVAEIKAGLLAGNVVLQFVDYEPIDANNVYVVAAVELDSKAGWSVLCIGDLGNTILIAENVDDYPYLFSN